MIDFETVIEGSINWSENDESNLETVSIIRSRKMAIKFSEEFISLIQKIRQEEK